MRTFLDFLRKYNYFFVFLLLEAVSLTILFRFNSFQGSVWFTAANDAVAGINRWYADGLSYMNLGECNPPRALGRYAKGLDDYQSADDGAP